MKHYITLTKPTISLLFAITGLAAIFVEGSALSDPLVPALITLAIYMVGGGANGLNQYFERDVDAQMKRTAKKRPLPQGNLTPQQALFFSVVLAVCGNFILLYWGNYLACLLGLLTVLFYSFYYTLWLKPRTPYNIVIGGAGGATGPLIGWAAVTGDLSWVAVFMFLIIFFWTPPHFWALALCCKEDYATVSYPMLPNVAGDDRTRKEIFLYSLTLLPLTLGLYFISDLGLFYLITSSLLGLYFIYGAWRVSKKKDTKTSWKFFGYSIAYLLLLFIFMSVDVLI